MNTQEKSILLRLNLRQEGALFHAELVAEETQIQLCDTGGFSHPRDAVYSALKSVATDNNFTGCLGLDVGNRELAHD